MSENSPKEKNIVLKIDDCSGESVSTSTFFDDLWKLEESESENEDESSSSEKNTKEAKNEKFDENQKIINDDIEELADSSSISSANDGQKSSNQKINPNNSIEPIECIKKCAPNANNKAIINEN